MLSATEDLCYGLAGAGNNSATQPPLPRPGCRGESKETGRKLVGRDKGSLTEQQTKGTGTTMIQKRGIHKTNPQNRACRTEPLSPRMPLRAPELRVSSRHPAPPTGTQHDGTWYGIPCSVWSGWVSLPGCAPSWIPVKINPVLAKPRTIYN